MAGSSSVSGADWSESEIDLIVADYFCMRDMWLRNEPFVKAHHYRAIMEETGRSKGSVESKYMNISATLERLSLPWLGGYAPLRNFQGALLRAVERYVEREWIDGVVPERPGVQASLDEPLFIETAPEIGALPVSSNPELERMARKFDPALRDERNRKIGLAGEQRVVESERARLARDGRPDLARKVKWISQELGDGAGYDIASFELDGSERFLEVKTTIGHKRTPFMLTRNEKDFAEEAGQRFRIFRLYNWGRAPGAFLIRPPLTSCLILEPAVYRASFG
ncbi:MAG TPA: DUF3883 domain-containing protein [Ottowia sp.]|uniref:DUF3883 domain-containing protein n=1 Tax=Ottowia sp. TaxID=1898956 RepID=UPI002CFC2EFA|nr:DUF3883 domain-containing protein [Ottowia sp.]HMN21292.1 DUF3883 domain-containing protein [Ottowia sp.]